MTTEAPLTPEAEALLINPHLAYTTEGSHYTCNAPECSYQMFHHSLDNHPAFRGEPEKQAAYWADLWKRSHAEQYAPGRAPDINVDWEISASCSVCPDRIGDVKMCEDGDAVCCQECGTHWSMNGTDGTREDAE